MAARAIASATISFGLVSVPVKLYVATRSKSLSFNLLHDKDKSRVRQQYVCTCCGEVVDRNAMVRGYEFAKDQYAVLSEDELRAAEERTDQSIEIEEFVPIAGVDPICFEKAYLLGPDKGGHKAYRLLSEAMARAGRGAVGKFSTRGRQQLVLLRQSEGVLILHGLHYADEVSSLDEIERGEETTFKPGEIDLAVQLIEQLASKSFEHDKYEDTYRRKLLEVIEQKVAGREIVAASLHPPRAKIIDLMGALKASLEAKQRERSEAVVAVGREGRRPARAKGRAAPQRKSLAKAK